MDDYAVYLAEEANSSIAALHQFRLLYLPKQDAYHFFFEGEEDSLYFMPEARRLIGGRCAHIYDCGGKKNVIEVRNAIKSEEYDISFCLFFVDRDFDDYLECQVEIDNYTYITDHYSIENNISCIESARIIMDDIVRISRADPDFAHIEARIEAGFDAFYRVVRPLMAWILAAKRTGCSPNLRNTFGLKGVVRLEAGLPSLSKAGFRTFKKSVVVNGQVPPISLILRFMRQLDITTPKSWVRGKYDVWFFQAALLSVFEETNLRRKAAGGRRIKIPNSLKEGRVFEMLGGRVSPPASLRAFLQSRLH
jgi:Protein of unknown function (DUF4435)